MFCIYSNTGAIHSDVINTRSLARAASLAARGAAQLRFCDLRLLVGNRSCKLASADFAFRTSRCSSLVLVSARRVPLTATTL